MRVGRDRRPVWSIDLTLEAFTGADVRVLARKFSPRTNSAKRIPPMHSVRELWLPNNTRPDPLPVFFEGNLSWFRRQIGVVTVCLAAPKFEDGAADGPVLLRGKQTIVIRGPAIVELEFPFQVERVPGDSANYWRDLRLPRAQFECIRPVKPAIRGGLREAGWGGETPMSPVE